MMMTTTVPPAANAKGEKEGTKVEDEEEVARDEEKEPQKGL